MTRSTLRSLARSAGPAAAGLLFLVAPAAALDDGGTTVRIDTTATEWKVDNPHGEFRADCNVCHVPQGWVPAKIGPDFDHAKYGYALDGAHQDVPCLLCHLTLEFNTSTGSTCDECHQDVHAGELGSECDRCHTTRSFIDRTNDVRIHRQTRFPLTGAHSTVDCASCHGPGDATAMQFTNTPTDCFFCHQDDYAQTTSPVHTPGSFPTDCTVCHTPFAWAGTGLGAFDHSQTRFPLTGAHLAVDCQQCHVGDQFAGTPTDCFSCHQTDYDTTTNPVHTPAAFPTNCVLCHSTAAWQPASFDHSHTAFPLTGAHRTVDCSQCHGNGQFTGTPTDCFACHSADYDNTTDPNHAAASFSTNCATCHSTTTWLGATFDHDTSFFPIYSGEHRGEWTNCATCHMQPTDFSVFTCFDCHEHRQSEMDGAHSSVGGYSYDSNACYSCHPQGLKE